MATKKEAQISVECSVGVILKWLARDVLQFEGTLREKMTVDL